MIKVKLIPIKENKFCTHCDKSAVFELWFCNEKIIQQSAAGCLCGECMIVLKTKMDAVVGV
jgi:hypothetical protein